MIIKELNQLNDQEIAEIRQLEEICKEYDGLQGNIYLGTSYNFTQEIKTTFLLYEEKQLVSVLSLFVPTSHEAEVSAYTLPAYRSRGYFTSLLEKALAELNKFQIPAILFVTEPESQSAKAVIQKLGGVYDFTEYSMTYQGGSVLGTGAYRVKLCTPGIEAVDALAKISEAVYGENFEEAKNMILNSLQATERQQYAIKLGDQFIGIGSASFGEEISIYGLGVLPEYQGNGYGKELLLLIIEELQKASTKKITLEVNSQNDTAFHLYQKYGFVVESSLEYYRKLIS